jgi:hypothetical protein
MKKGRFYPPLFLLTLVICKEEVVMRYIFLVLFLLCGFGLQGKVEAKNRPLSLAEVESLERAPSRPSEFSIHQASGSVQAIPSWIAFTSSDVSDGRSSSPRPASFLTIHFNGQSPFFGIWGIACGVGEDGSRIWISQLRANLTLLDERSMSFPVFRLVSDIDRDRVSIRGHWFVDGGEVALHLPGDHLMRILFETQEYLTLEFPIGEVVHRVTFELHREAVEDLRMACES